MAFKAGMERKKKGTIWKSNENWVRNWWHTTLFMVTSPIQKTKSAMHIEKKWIAWDIESSSVCVGLLSSLPGRMWNLSSVTSGIGCKKAWNGDRWTLCLKIPSIFLKNSEIDFKSSVCIEYLLAGHQLTAVRLFHAITSIKKIASWVTFCTLHSNLKQGTKNYWMWKLKEWAIEHRIGREEWKRMALIRTFSTWMEISAPLNIVLVPTSRW